MKHYHYIFGPVPSRRLGRSLGVDLIPYKTCSYDCIYCQLGVTTDKTVTRREYVPVESVLQELESKLNECVPPDYITLSGSGEPTLHSGIGEVIKGIKKITDTPVAVLTNASLLWMEDVRNELASADLVVPSLDAGDPVTFQKINRPANDVTFSKMVEGLLQFSREFTGETWLEVFIVKGVNDSPEQVKLMAEIVEEIDPDRIQINTTTRPPAEEEALPVSEKTLKNLAGLFHKKPEIIAQFRVKHGEEYKAAESDVIEMISRRPCTMRDVANGLGISENEVVKYISHLLDSEEIMAEKSGGRTYYKIYGAKQ